jgi:hypothetical protein
MKYDQDIYTGALQALDQASKAQGKTAARPGQRRVLHERPTAPLLLESFFGILQGPAPALFSPSNAPYFERVAPFMKGLCKKIAVVFQRVSWLILATEQSDPSLAVPEHLSA